MKMSCPVCKSEFNCSLQSAIAPEQRLFFELSKEQGHEEEMFSADAVGASLSAIVEALNATAESLGGKVTVFLAGVTHSPGKLSFELVSVESKARTR